MFSSGTQFCIMGVHFLSMNKVLYCENAFPVHELSFVLWDACPEIKCMSCP